MIHGRQNCRLMAFEDFTMTCTNYELLGENKLLRNPFCSKVDAQGEEVDSLGFGRQAFWRDLAIHIIKNAILRN